MKVIFTICSNNYLAQAIVLADSVKILHPEVHFFIGLVDKRMPGLNYEAIHAEIIDVELVEPNIKVLAEKFNIVELNTCVKPSYFRFFFDMLKAEQVTYLDPDTCLFDRMAEVDKALITEDIILTPHIVSPIPMDGKTPEEPLFLNYGVYNLGFIAMKKSDQVDIFLKWWNERTYEKGFDRPAMGLFTDQLWINLVPVIFDKVHILKHMGYNMGPWNLHERSLVSTEKGYEIQNGSPLVFFHFSGFHPAIHKIHNDYNRYLPKYRPDLSGIYENYRNALIEAGFDHFQTLPCFFVVHRNAFLLRMEKEARQQKLLQEQSLPFYRQVVRNIKKRSPAPIRKLMLQLLNA